MPVLPGTPFPYSMKETRIVSVQLVRVFFIVRVILMGRCHIVLPPVSRA